MSKTIEVAVSSTVAAALFLIPTAILNPPPIPSLTALAGGLLCLWCSQRRPYVAGAAGAVGGAVLGTGVHLYQHDREGRLDPEEGLLLHLFADGISGLAIAAVVLAILFALHRAVTDRFSQGVESR